MLAPWKKSYDKPRQHIQKQKHYFANKGPSSQGYGFSSGHVWMWELDCEESWALKNWCFWTVVLEKTLESPLDCKEIQPAHSKGDQSWVFIGRTDVEAETPILWSSDAKSWLTHLKRPWGWERLRAGGERDNRGWDNWMASPTQRTWVWVNSGSWWWTGRPGVLRFMGSQRVGHDWVTELTHGCRTTETAGQQNTYNWIFNCTGASAPKHHVFKDQLLHTYKRSRNTCTELTSWSHKAGLWENRKRTNQ